MTLRELAEQAGVSVMTVSRALRDRPGVSAPQRAKIKRLAEKLGYRPDPFVTAFLHNTRFNRTRAYRATLALVVQNDSVREVARFHRTLHGAQEQGRRLGFAIEVFAFDDEHTSPARLAQILRARGILGVLLDRVLPTPRSAEFPWADFACVALNWKLRPAFTAARHNALDGVALAFEHLLALGYRRPGLCCDPASDQEVARAQQAGFLLGQQALPARARIPVLTGMDPAQFQALVADHGRHAPFLSGIARGPFERWFRRHQPDVVLSSFRLLLDFLEAMRVRVPQDTAFISLNRVGDLAHLAGVDQNHERIAAAAVNLLARKLELAELGFTPQPDTMVLAGTWHDGASAPRHAVQPRRS
jgi:LacI family transcriptional regulator